jgi:hypothetical protein
MQYTGDIAWYAFCSCGFSYPCSRNKRNIDGSWSYEQEIANLYNYCPFCGAKKKYYDYGQKKKKE